MIQYITYTFMPAEQDPSSVRRKRDRESRLKTPRKGWKESVTGRERNLGSRRGARGQYIRERGKSEMHK